MNSKPAFAVEATIAVCTYRRDSLRTTLASLAGQAPDEVSMEVVVIDNDVHDGKRSEIEAVDTLLDVPLRYVHAPAQNISTARNAALSTARGRWLLFIDDDEEATPGWAAALLAARGKAEAVVGDCQATYDPSFPDWIQRLDLHSTRLRGRSDTAYSGNVMIDLDFVQEHDLKFRNDLGRTGGEDTLFFRGLTAAGGRIVSVPEALVFEPVPPARASLDWLVKRQYRFGETHAIMQKAFSSGRFRYLGPLAAGKTGLSAMMAGLTVFRPDTARRWWIRASLHAGAFRKWLSLL